ncbi:hypothetical protein [Alkaliphilus sp. B6464]|uniref:hypothetical protein n=1 Tax=Alkaliphilus sp. B6464 TaxID=2731219 RepID=UPI001BAC60FD|nr:hypothetical protein [Alkaliphilus sp. B6464]QUH18538.1 hypothetical protein HYG84_00530 [Alkaliphilus sp. B6464]
MIHLNEKNYSDIYRLEKQQYNLGGRVFMSLLSLSLKLGYFNVNISINRDEAKRKEKAANALRHELLVQEAIERRAKAQADYHYINSFIQLYK